MPAIRSQKTLIAGIIFSTLQFVLKDRVRW